MPYHLMLRSPDLMWVVMHGQMDMAMAEAYLQDTWHMLDGCPTPTDMLVDGRGMKSGDLGGRRHTEQVLHHPNLGHVAFVVGKQHLLMFAPLVRFVSGIGLFGNEDDAVKFLQSARHLPPLRETGLLNLMKRSSPPTFVQFNEKSLRNDAQENGVSSTAPWPGRPRGSSADTLQRLSDMVDSLAFGIAALRDNTDFSRRQ